MPVIAGGSMSWADEVGTTYQIWAPWVRADLSRSLSSRGEGQLSDSTGRLRNHGCFSKSGPAQDPARAREHAQMREQVEVLADSISQLEGIRWGLRGMVRQAILGLYDALLGVLGGAAAAGQFRDMLVGIADARLHCDDNALYDDSTPRPPEVKSNAVPEEVAARGLGPAGHVSLASSLWRKCVPPRLRAVYRRHARTFRGEHPRHQGPREAALRRMFESVHKVTKGVEPTAGRVSAAAFLTPKSTEKCRLLLNAPSINACDDRPQPRMRLPALSSIFSRFAREQPGGLYMCQLNLTNAYWSIKLPKRWRRIFVIRVGGRRWRFTRLPFG